MAWNGRGYRPGTRVQHKNGVIFVKTEDGVMVESRRVWELTKGELSEGDKVYHIDGDRTNNKPNNLAKIHFNATKFVMLKESKVLWATPEKLNAQKNGKILIAA
jgi:hypothetical protein